MRNSVQSKLSYLVMLKWAYVRHLQVELLETLEADRPRPLPADAPVIAIAAHATAEKEWKARERKRRLLLQDFENHAPAKEAFTKLLEATESARTREIFRKQYNDAMAKAKDEEKAQELIQQDDGRRLDPLFEALYRERPELEEAVRRYHATRKPVSRPDTGERNRKRAEEARRAKAAPPDTAAGTAADAGEPVDAAVDAARELETAGT